MKNQKGFSLIELLIVVVIIGIIAAIAIPNLLASRRAANEASAVAALRTLHGAQMTYASTNGNGNFAGSTGAATIAALADLGPDGAAGVGLGPRLVDGVLGSGTKGGYNFVGARVAAVAGPAGTPATFFYSSIPTAGTGLTQTGTRRFGVDTDGVLVADPTVSAIATHFDATTIGTCKSAPVAGGCGPLNN